MWDELITFSLAGLTMLVVSCPLSIVSRWLAELDVTPTVYSTVLTIPVALVIMADIGGGAGGSSVD